MNFGGIDKKFSEFKKAFFAVLPVPYDLTSTYQSGSRRGPSAILEASCNMELYDEELRRETYRAGIHTLPPLEPDARGPREMIKKVEESVAGIIRYNKVPVMLGGEHSISTGSVRA
ncbi:MAG TPA: arginase family protein, partial [Syntrophales bacterium]|nr:arginase family protein [Syntrophales bacterium]